MSAPSTKAVTAARTAHTSKVLERMPPAVLRILREHAELAAYPPSLKTIRSYETMVNVIEALDEQIETTAIHAACCLGDPTLVNLRGLVFEFATEAAGWEECDESEHATAMFDLSARLFTWVQRAKRAEATAVAEPTEPAHEPVRVRVVAEVGQ